MSTVRGTVDKVNIPDQYGKASILVNGKWYNTRPDWLPTTPSQGDTVEFDDGGRNYIKKLKVVSSGGPVASSSSGNTPTPTGGRTFPVGVTAPERTINRQNALTNAVNYYNHTGRVGDVSPEDVIDTARIFEEYTTGDLDLREATEAMDTLQGS